MAIGSPEVFNKSCLPASWYLRVSVTDACNLTCKYCLPEVSITEKKPKSLKLSELEKLIYAVDSATPIRKIRITGGEPLIRPGLDEMIRNIAERLPSAELSLTTNGILLDQFAKSLKSAGLDRINISIDSPDVHSFASLTGGGDLSRIVRGIKAARSAGFNTIKLNTVLLKNHNAENMEEIIRFAAQYQCQIRFIELMPLAGDREFFDSEYISCESAIQRIEDEYGEMKSLGQNGTASEYLLRVNGSEIKVGFISSVSSPFCTGCDRLRLDSYGVLHTCLRNGRTLPLTEIENIEDVETAGHIIGDFVSKKTLPQKHWEPRQMVSIGG